MKGRNFLYFVLFVALALLPLAGCSGGGGSAGTVVPGEKGVSLTVGGSVGEGDAGKSLAKMVGLDTDPIGTVSVLDAATGLPPIGSATTVDVAADGSFTGLSFTLPIPKSIIVFKAVVPSKSATPFYAAVPIDLSNPPAAGIGASNAINILIGQASTNTAAFVSSSLSLPGTLGDGAANAIPAGSNFTTVAQLVTQYGGQVLAYNTSGLNLTGTLNETLLPALDANALSSEQVTSLVLQGAVTRVSIPGNNPIISFQVTNKASGKGIRGLKTFAFAIAQLQQGANGSPEAWMSYMVSSLTSRPSNEGTGALIDNGDGSYSYKMVKDVKTTGATTGVTYDANLTHRVAVEVYLTNSFVMDGRGNIVNPYVPHGATAPTASSFSNPANIIYDFVPASGGPATGMLQREVTTTAACNECHTSIGVSTPHGGRVDTRYCVVCHTKQRANGRTGTYVKTSVDGVFSGASSTAVADGEVMGNMVTMIHKLHMGSRLAKSGEGYNYANILLNEIVYPQDVTNCRKCHRTTTGALAATGAQGDNWETKPSRQACGACHDGINFANGTNLNPNAGTFAVHKASGGVTFTDDSSCAGCHVGDGSMRSVAKYHMTINATPNNPNVAAGLTNFTYEIKSATVDGSNQAVITFRILASTNGSTPTAVTFGGGSSTNAAPLDGFTGSPSFLLAYSLGAANQPFTTSPDYNNAGVKAAQPVSVSIANLYDGTKGTLAAGTGADAGYYVATIKGDKAPPLSSPYSFPVGATMRTVALQAYFTQKAGTNGIASATARHAIAVQKPVTNEAVRRNVIDPAKCGNCHEWFEGHGGNRVYTVQVCVTCHVPNLSSSGKGANPASVSTDFSADGQASLIADGYTLADPTTYPEDSVNMKDMIHGIHAGSSRTNPYRIVAAYRAGTDTYFSAAEFVFPGILKNCQMCHTPTGYTSIPDGAQVSTNVTSDGTVLTLANAKDAVAAARTSVPNAQDIVTTPFAASCVTCHDTAAAKAHVTQNGGQIRVLRSAADPSREACVVCHGPSGSASISSVHK